MKTSSYSDREQEAYDILKNACQRDDCSIYGEHVANELRSLSSRARTIVKHTINNTLFEAAMGKYDEPHHASTPVHNSDSSSCFTVLSSGTENMVTRSSVPLSDPLHSNYNYSVTSPPCPSTTSACQKTFNATDQSPLASISEFLTLNNS